MDLFPRDPFPAGRFLSEAEAAGLLARIPRYARGPGTTHFWIFSNWAGNLRWARNGITTSGDIRQNVCTVLRTVLGAQSSWAPLMVNVLDDRHLIRVMRRAERLLAWEPLRPESVRPEPWTPQPMPRPTIWFDATYRQDPAARAEIVERLVRSARAAGMLSAGYIEVSATGMAALRPDYGVRYYPFTWAQCSMTVRAPDGNGSGWAGVDWNDWSRIDADHLAAVALEKCLRSRNPVRLEPGRYTTILEPQAAGELVARLFEPYALDRAANEGGDPPVLKTDPRYKKDPRSVFNDAPGYSKLGEQVIDARLTVRTDCTDPDLGFRPFNSDWTIYRPVTWIEDGVLTALAYDEYYAIHTLGLRTGGQFQWGWPLTAGAFRMSVKGETVSVEEMIATTKRGLLVTRFWGLEDVSANDPSLLRTGYTRDGLWLVENGKLSKAVKNFRFTESPVFVLNNLEQLGVPQRIFAPPRVPGDSGVPMVVPAMKVRDFSFTAMSDAI